jgi:NAD dependent epimerase/dehydratase
VTGAGGFIGSRLVEHLVQRGASVRAFVRYTSRGDYGWLDACPAEVLDDVDVFRGDLANPEAVSNAVAGTDTVLHLGALIPIPYSYLHAREYVAANVVGTLNVLEAVRRHGIRRVVHTSTSEVYGTPDVVPITEEHPLRAQSPYAATKIGADQLALSYWRSFGIPIVVVRPFNTFGPRQSARAVIPTIISQAFERDAIELGSTHPTRDFLFVDDTVAGIERCSAADGVEGEVINLGTGVEISVGKVAERVLRMVGRNLPIVTSSDRIRPPDSEVERLLADTSKARSLLGWRSTVDFDEGLRRTIDWLRESAHLYNSSLYNV